VRYEGQPLCAEEREKHDPGDSRVSSGAQKRKHARFYISNLRWSDEQDAAYPLKEGLARRGTVEVETTCLQPADSFADPVCQSFRVANSSANHRSGLEERPDCLVSHVPRRSRQEIPGIATHSVLLKRFSER